MNLRITILVAALVCGVAYVVRAPLITAGAPYFYQEDDAHHFNRTVEMYQRGDLNPRYFNKPSLHFYLRLPVVMASVSWAKKQNELRSAKEIRTRDPYGLAGFAFTASHPTIVAWNRAFSIVLSLGLVLMTFLITRQLALESTYAAFAALVPAFSLEVVRNSHIVGVDVLMALMCLACTSVGIIAVQQFSIFRMMLSGIFAGLAASSKYNAAPIALVPAVVCILKKQASLKTLSLAVLSVISAFLLASPYVLLTFETFKEGVSYELWHYGVAGHVEHSAEPGIQQALFYLKWLSEEGTGVVVAFLALIGITVCLLKRGDKELVILTFPLAYIALMVMQKTNFTRNMVVIVPYVAICAAIGIKQALQPLHLRALRVLVGTLVAVVSLLPQAIQSLQFVVESVLHHESRNDLSFWLHSLKNSSHDVAISGPLQLPIQTFNLQGVDAFSPDKRTIPELFQKGFSYVVVPTSQAGLDDIESAVTTVMTFPGSSPLQRVPDSPAIAVLGISDPQLFELAKRAPASLTLKPSKMLNTLGCENSQEAYCWVSDRITQIHLAASSDLVAEQQSLQLEIMSPWPDQSIEFVDSIGGTIESVHIPTPGRWVPFSLPPINSASPLAMKIKIIHSPASQGTGGDNRRLGVAIRLVK